MRRLLVAVGVIGLLSGPLESQDVPAGNPKVKAGIFKGQAARAPWSGTWWPMVDGELGLGWNGLASYTYNPATKKYEFNPGVAVNDLSPLAKYDKAFGNPPSSGAAAYELHATGSFVHHIYGDLKEKYDQEGVDYTWWGHCNGWAAAAVLEREPIASIEFNGVRFEVADLKGLLTESHFGVVSSFSGTRYNEPPKGASESFSRAKELLEALGKPTQPSASEYRKWYEKAFNTTLPQDYTPQAYKGALEYYIKNYTDKYVKAYEDLRPDVFHKILLKVIGEQKSAVVFDITAGAPVWNYPAFAYEMKIVDKGKTKIDGVTRRVFECTTQVTFADDGVSESILGTRSFVKTYTYELYTTPVFGYIRGGKWIGASVDNHPDFAWLPTHNPTGVDDDENAKLIWGKVLEILPKTHLVKDTKGVQLFANGIGSESRRTAANPITYANPVLSGSNVTLSVQTSLPVAKVKYFKQKVSQTGGILRATRDPLVALGEGATLTVSMPAGVHMIVCYAYDAAGRLLAMDEIAVKVQ